jgi:hypothetical protein
MNCPTCGKRSRVVDSRLPTDGRVEVVTRRALEVAGWYTQDFVARRRACDCGWKTESIEILVEDLGAMLAHRGDK